MSWTPLLKFPEASRVNPASVPIGFTLPSKPVMLRAQEPAKEDWSTVVCRSSVPLPVAPVSNSVISPCVFEVRTKSKPNDPDEVLTVAVPRPSAVTLYLLPLVTVRLPTPSPWGLFTSKTPPVMPPLPSAVSVPVISTGKAFKSEPITEKTYVPLKLLFLKPPVGGGTTLVLLLQPARTASAERTMGRTRRLHNDINIPLTKYLAQR